MIQKNHSLTEEQIQHFVTFGFLIHRRHKNPNRQRSDSRVARL